MKRLHLLLLGLIVLVSCQNQELKPVSIVPYPNDIQLRNGSLEVSGQPFHYDESFDEASVNAITAFAGQLSKASGKPSQTAAGTARDGFIFILNPELPKEAYKLSVSKKAVVTEASSLNGVIYAIQTIKQLLPVEIFGSNEAADADWRIRCIEIEDAPRFGYRGMHMDVSRHFFDIDAVKRYLDIMEIHKLNTLHWHLTDDQGWRIEIKKYPRLTEVGSIRKKTVIGHISRSSEYDHTPYGEGCWFTQDQIREVIAYAASKGITVIPEIDLPGHMLAALTAYPELGCTGGPYDVWGDWGISDDVLCVGKENTMKFLEDVLDEICGLFPAEYVHIGGDECPKVRWENCPHCQAKIKELGLKDDDKHTAEHYLQSYVTARMEKFLTGKGKKLIGWDEILEGEVAPNATIMSWRGVAGGLQAVRMGHDAIMTPNTYFYLDYYQSLDRDNEPLGIGGYLPIEKCYSYEPTVEGMTEEEQAHILGVQANLWTEYIATEDHLHYMLLPRMAALSEVQWCNKDRKCWDRFQDSADELCAIYDVKGYNYATHIFDTKGEVSINRESNNVEVTLKTQGDAPIRYTLDGTDPDENSTLYTAPVKIEGTCTIKARAFRKDQEARTFTKSFTGHKAMGKPSTGHNEPHRSYTFTYPDNLTDGIRGADSYASGEWVGMYAKPLDVTIDMGGEEKYSSVTLGTFIVTGDFVFNPTYMKISVSEDGKEFTEIAHTDFQMPVKHESGIKDFTVEFPETSARFLKVTAGTIEALPEWHGAHGSKGFLFVDEISVK